MKKPLTLFLILLPAAPSPIYSLPSIGAEDKSLSSWLEPEETLIDASPNLNVVFLEGDISPDKEGLEKWVRNMLPRYAPYITYEKKFLGVNFTEINLIIASREMVEGYAEFIKGDKLIFRESPSPVKAVQNYFKQLRVNMNGDKIYWVDIWGVEEWLNEKGQEYLRISPDNYTIYLIVSVIEVEAVIEYYIVAPETGVETAATSDNCTALGVICFDGGRLFG